MNLSTKSLVKILIVAVVMGYFSVGYVFAGPLHDAVRKKRRNDVLKLLKSNPDLSEQDDRSRTVISYAAENGDYEMMRILINAASLNLHNSETSGTSSELHATHISRNLGLALLDGNGHTAFYHCLQSRNLKVIFLLLALGEGITEVLGKDTLAHAIWSNDDEAFDALINREGFDANLRDSFGYTSFTWAAMCGRTKFLRELLKLINKSFLLPDILQTAFLLAAINGRVELVRVLVEEFGADINVRDGYGRTALHYAAINGQVEVVRVLGKEFGANPNARDELGRTALHDAAINDQVEVVRVLVEEFGADINARDRLGRTALHDAAINDQVELVRVLGKEFGANPNARDELGRTALHDAAINGQMELVRVLGKEFDANINVRDQLRRTALHYAAENGQVEVVRVLGKELNADVNASNDINYPLLHDAARSGQVEVVRVLVEEFGADINVRDNYGRTALHDAARNGHEAIVCCLVELGVDVSVRDNYGRTALDVAPGIFDYLLQRSILDVVF